MSEMTSHLSTALAERHRIEPDGEWARASTGEHGDESLCHIMPHVEIPVA